MPKVAAALSDLQIRRLKEDGVYAVGGVPGLMLRVKGNHKAFFIRYMSPVTKKRREMAIGAYGVYTLKQARDRAAELRMQIGDGTDPLYLREENLKRQREEATRKAQAAYTVSNLLDDYIQYKDKFSDWSEKERDLFLSRYGRYIRPVLEKQAVCDVTADQVATVLQPFCKEHPAVAKKVRGMLRRMFAWARARGVFEGADPVDPKVLFHLLPRAQPKDRHMAMLAVRDVPRFMAMLRTREGTAARCLEFAILTATRSSNARLAKWEEIDWNKKQWVIPAEKMKVSANDDHVVPLSDQVVKLLEEMKAQRYSEYIFPSPRQAALSDGAFRSVIESMHMESLQRGEGGFVDPKQKTKDGLPAIATPHGIARASFRTWAQDDELGNDRRFNERVAELCLHHKTGDAYNGAYERNQAMKSRVEMMQAWADYCLSEVKNDGTF